MSEMGYKFLRIWLTLMTLVSSSFIVNSSGFAQDLIPVAPLEALSNKKTTIVEVDPGTSYASDEASFAPADSDFASSAGNDGESAAPAPQSNNSMEENQARQFPVAAETTSGKPADVEMNRDIIVREDDLKGALSEAINEGASKNRRITVLRVMLPSRVKMPASGCDFAFSQHGAQLDFNDRSTDETIWRENLRSGPQSLEVRCLPREPNAKSPPSFIVEATLRVEGRAPVAKRNLRNGDVVRSSDLAWVWLPADRLGSAYAEESSAIVGRELRGFVMAGRPFLSSQLERPMALNRGQTVTLVLHAGGLTVTGKGQALSPGAIGDTINVVYPATHKTLQARIVDSSMVEVIQ